MVFLSSAAHQPSSSRSMVIPPHLSISMKRSGTPVSVSRRTSRRQQQASQLKQLTSAASGSVSVRFIISLVIKDYSPAASRKRSRRSCSSSKAALISCMTTSTSAASSLSLNWPVSSTSGFNSPSSYSAQISLAYWV